MPTITIEIPQKVLARGATRRLIVVDPKEFEKELRRRWEIQDAKHALLEARRAQKEGKLRRITDLKELMK